LIPFAGLLGIRFTSLDHPWTLVGCTWLQYLIGAPVIISWNLLATNVKQTTARTMQRESLTYVAMMPQTSNFASALIKGFGFSGINATLLQLPTGAVEAVVVPICGIIATYVIKADAKFDEPPLITPQAIPTPAQQRTLGS
jgi:hypothetical protein